MSFVSVILLSVFGIVCCSNYIHDKKDVERSLDMALRLKDKDFSISFGNSRNFNGNSFVIYTDSNYEYMITSRSVWNIYADYTEVETMPKLFLNCRRYQGFRLNISA